MTGLVVVVFPIVLGLGYWQLSRGAEKRSMEMDYLSQLTALPVAPEAGALQQRFKRIQLRGRFTEQAFLVDNQVANGRVGYWLVQAFDEVGGLRLLLNRGFVEAPLGRGKLPHISNPGDDVRLIGAVWPFTGLVPVLDDDTWLQGWPKRVQRLDVARMAGVGRCARCGDPFGAWSARCGPCRTVCPTTARRKAQRVCRNLVWARAHLGRAVFDIWI